MNKKENKKYERDPDIKLSDYFNFEIYDSVLKTLHNDYESYDNEINQKIEKMLKKKIKKKMLKKKNK